MAEGGRRLPGIGLHPGTAPARWACAVAGLSLWVLGVLQPLPVHAQAAAAAPEVDSRQVNQHVVLGVLAAQYHCAHGAWPRDIATLKTAYERDPLRLPVAPDWGWLTQPGARLTVGEDLVFSTPGGGPEAAIAVTSTHQPPGCGDGKLNPKIDLHLGD